jgi:N-acetyl-gamma-glutamylphosphate reductase
VQSLVHFEEVVQGIVFSNSNTTASLLHNWDSLTTTFSTPYQNKQIIRIFKKSPTILQKSFFLFFFLSFFLSLSLSLFDLKTVPFIDEF